VFANLIEQLMNEDEGVYYVGNRQFSLKDHANNYARLLNGVVTPHPNPDHTGFKVTGKAHKDHSWITPGLMRAIKDHNSKNGSGSGDTQRHIVNRAAEGKYGQLRYSKDVKVSPSEVENHIVGTSYHK
jgi:hypothetical protein